MQKQLLSNYVKQLLAEVHVQRARVPQNMESGQFTCCYEMIELFEIIYLVKFPAVAPTLMW